MQRAKIILDISHKIGEAEPEKEKTFLAAYTDTAAAKSGIPTDKKGYTLKDTLLRRRIYESEKLNSSIIIITIAYPDISNTGIRRNTRTTDSRASAMLTHIEKTCSPMPLSIESVT